MNGLGNSIRTRAPCKRSEWVGPRALDQVGPSFPSSRINDAHERTQDTWPITRSAVGVVSTARRKRNHHDEMILRAYSAGTSAMSNATRPKPPPCSKRSVALNARSMPPAQRIHNKRAKSIPASAADAGANASPVSTSAQISSRDVNSAKTESSRLARPEDARPKISVMAPRGKPPPVKESISGTPVERNSANRFSRSLTTSPKRLTICDSRVDLKIAALI